MTININAANISSVRLAEQSGTPGTPSPNFARIYVSTTPRLRMMDDAGAVTEYIGNTSGSGVGITFPASQSASTDANTLDDYEEGTWTPVLSGSAGSAGTYATTVAAGTYTKIGRVVIITAAIALSNLGSWSGNVLCSLPITSSAVGNDNPKGTVRVQQHTFTGTVIAELASTTTIRFNLTASGTAQTNWQWSSLVITAGNFLNFSLAYDAA